ncbi:hypothetical protein BS17DRAFT_494770 [Gyrodon lividus]|nr:hypothetical protein BS17DRAFT_494770 [Gyrodon lividus]
MVAENDVDLETLQAQIDMSMSFAHNLVTSWIKPTQLAQLRYNGTNATQILEEELRRPPRLGVGAPIPAMVSEAGEASKLKHRLVKSGRKNENGGPGETKTQGPSKSDDEEHKGRTTKRKTKVDPFALEGSKKRRKVNSILVSLPLEIGQQGAVECAAPTDEAPFSQNEILGEHFDHKLSPRKTKQRSDQELLGCLRQGSVPLTSPRPVTLPPRVQSSLSPSRTAPTLGSPAELSRKSARTSGTG